MAGTAAAQTQSCPANEAVCIVESGQILNNVINGDTTAAGDRVNLDRIYQLSRNSLYLMNNDVRNEGYHLRIYGEESTEGSIPQVYTTLNPDSGDPVGDPFGMQGDVTFRNWAMAGVLPETPFPNISTRVMRVRAPGFDLVMDRFIAVNFKASIVRAQSALRKFEMTNSVWANSGWLGDNGTNFGAGKGIDLRDGSIDSLIIRNSTFVNYTDRIIRHRNSTAPIQNMIFDHNTVLNTISYHGMIALGDVGESVQITNNLFYDPFVAGADSSDVVRQEEFNESGEVYASNGQAAMQWISSVPNETTDWTIANNAYVITDEVQNFYQLFGDGGGDDGNPDNGTDGDNDIIDEGPPLTDHILGRISNPGTAFQAFDFDLANAPNAPIDMVTWYRTETGRTKETITFNAETDDYDRRDVQYFLNDFDAAYPTSSDAYTLASGACPAGDLNWFPSEFDRCDGIMVANEDDVTSAAAFSLANHPNPFAASTTITYELPEADQVTLKVYNILGQEVATLVNDQRQTAGAHSVRWEGTDAQGRPVANGMYIYQLQTDAAMHAKRMVVLN